MKDFDKKNKDNDDYLIYKYYSPSEYSLDALINRYFWFSKREFLNDPFDLGNFKVGNDLLSVINVLAKNYGGEIDVEKDLISNQILDYASCSFTNSELDKQMWAYYTQDYHGWCLAFQRGEMNTKNESPLSPVIYVSDNLKPISLQPNCQNYGNNSRENLIRRILCTKHESWKHEQEERMVIKMKGKNTGDKRAWGTYELKHITIGNKMNSPYKQIILTMAKMFNINVYEIMLNNKNFSLDKRKLL